MTVTQNIILINKLDEFIRKYYKNQLIKGILYSSGLLVSAYLTVVLLEYLGEFDTTIRSILFYSFLATSVFVLVKYVAVPVLKLKRFGKIISYEEAATIIGTHFGSVQDKLLNVLQLQSEKNLSGSDELLLASINQKINELKPVPFTSAINISENKKYLKFVLPPLFLTIGIAIIWPNIISKSTSRLVHHQTYFESEAPFTFNIQNNELKAMQQQDFVLQVKLEGSEIPNELFIKVDGSEFKLEKENNITFNYTFKNVQRSSDFVLSGAGYNSKGYKLEVMPKPSLMQFSVKLKYPAYLNKKDETITNSGDLQIPQGTKVTWNFNTKNTNNLFLGFSDTTFNLNESAKDQFTFSKLLLQSTGYYIKTKNQFVSTYGDSVNYGINVLADQIPYIDVSEKADSTNFKSIYFSGSVKDDYGFTKLLFHYTHYTTDSLGNSKQIAGEKLLGINKTQVAQSYYYYFDANAFELKPGDKIEYYFEVWDNDGVNGAKPSKTKMMAFKAPTIDEVNEAAGKNNEEIKKDLDESIKKAKELQKDLDALSKKMNDKKQMGWEEKKKIEDILNKQKNLEKKIDEVKQENQQNNQMQNEFSQQDESIMEKQKQLEKLMENVMSPEMKKMFNELQKLMDQMDKNQVQQKIEEMKLTNKDIEKELDRALEAFKQFEVEQKLQQAIDKLDELQKKEEQLNKDTENKKQDDKKQDSKTDDRKDDSKKDDKKSDDKNDEKNQDAKGDDKKQDDKNADDKKDNSKNPDAKNDENKTPDNKDNKNADNKNNKSPDNKDLKQKQDDIAKEFDKLKEELKELDKKNAELEQPNKLADTKEEQQKASEEMSNSSESLNKNNKKSASKSQKEAQKEMGEMKEKMEQAQAEMEEKEEEENAASLRQILENLLNLSFSQEELIKTLPKTRVDNPQYTKIPQQQKKLQDDSKIIEDSLLALSKRAPQISAFVNREISSINDNMKKTVAALADRIPSDAGMRMQSSMTSINNLALLLNEELEKMQSEQKDKKKMKGQGSGKCKKPKANGEGKVPKKGQPSMSQMQKQLNEQLKQLKEQLAKGEKPGQKPGQKPGDKPGQKPGMGMGQQNQGQMPNMMPGTSEQLAKMAAQQEALRRQLQQMMDQMKNKGQNPGGNLADMMEQTEKDIVNKSITQETMKRQEDILTKLLESEKAEREREQDEKRKSTEAKNENLSNPSQFLEYKRMKEKELELLNTVPPSLTPFYKEKVNNYFNSVSK
jgi:hypothetical protein